MSELSSCSGLIMEVEVPADWCAHPLVGENHKQFVANLFCVLTALKAKVQLREIRTGLDFEPRQSENLLFSYHSIGNEPNVWRIKEGPIPFFFLFDRYGYSGWAEVARDKSAQRKAEHFSSEVDSARTRKIVDEILAKNISKYPQSELRESLPKGFVFFPLQVQNDTVLRLSKFDYLSVVERVAQIATEKRELLVIKRHPLCESEAVEKLLNRLKSEWVVVTSASVHECITHAKAVLCCNSGVGFEALLHDKPVFIFGESEYNAAAEKIDTLHELEKIFNVETSITNIDRWNFVHYFLSYCCFDARDPGDIREKVERAIKESNLIERVGSRIRSADESKNKLNELSASVTDIRECVDRLSRQVTNASERTIENLRHEIEKKEEQWQSVAVEAADLRAQLLGITSSRSFRFTRAIHGLSRKFIQRKAVEESSIPAEEGDVLQLRDSPDYKIIHGSRLFDGDWYASHYIDVAQAEIDPLLHFVGWGAKERRNPSAFFDVDWYLRTYEDVRTAEINALTHYILFGAREGRSPHPLFDVEWYVSGRGMEIDESSTALQKYLDGIGEENVWPMNVLARCQSMLQLKDFSALDLYLSKISARNKGGL